MATITNEQIKRLEDAGITVLLEEFDFRAMPRGRVLVIESSNNLLDEEGYNYEASTTAYVAYVNRSEVKRVIVRTTSYGSHRRGITANLRQWIALQRVIKALR